MKKSYYKKAAKARSYRKKRYTGSNGGSSILSKQLAVMYNPFSTATDTPKIPDGSTSSSLGERLNFVFEFDKTHVGNLLDTETLVAELSLSASYETLIRLSKKFSVTENKVYSLHESSVQENLPSTFADSWLNQLNQADIDKVRIVSCGYRFSLMNNADDNEGWFMAARMDTSTVGAVYKDPQICNGFVAGKLRDIHKYQFTLHPSGREFPWLTGFLGQGHWHSSDTGEQFANTVEDRHSGFDTIALKISGGKTTKLMCHISVNVEFCIKESAGLFRYQTVSLAYPQMVDSIIPKLRADPRAAIPVTGSFPVA